MKRRSVTVVSLIVLVGCFVCASPAIAAAPATTVRATLDGRPVEAINTNEPLRLRPGRELKVRVEISNRTGKSMQVRSVRLNGRVLGLTFFTYTARIDLPLEPGATDSRQFELDLSDLGAEATGLLPAEIALLGPDRKVLAESAFPVRVEGSLSSAYGMFGLVVALATMLLLGAALIRLAMGLLPEHRWYRAVRFAIPGLGLGLTATFTVSAFALLVPNPGTWVALVVGGGLIGLVLGFLTPTPSHSAAQPHAEEEAGTIDLDAPAAAETAQKRIGSS